MSFNAAFILKIGPNSPEEVLTFFFHQRKKMQNVKGTTAIYFRGGRTKNNLTSIKSHFI